LTLKNTKEPQCNIAYTHPCRIHQFSHEIPIFDGVGLAISILPSLLATLGDLLTWWNQREDKHLRVAGLCRVALYNPYMDRYALVQYTLSIPRLRASYQSIMNHSEVTPE